MRKFFYVLMVVTSITFLSGCSNLSNVQKNMYDNDNLIVKEGDSYSFLNRIGSTTDTKMEVQYGKFYGSQTIWMIDITKQGEIQFDFASQVDNGKFKGVLISDKGGMTTIFEGTESGSQVIEVPQGQYRFKIVGNDAKGNASIELELDENMKVTIF